MVFRIQKIEFSDGLSLKYYILNSEFYILNFGDALALIAMRHGFAG